MYFVKIFLFIAFSSFLLFAQDNEDNSTLNGRIIRGVSITTLDVSGPSVDDSTGTDSTTWLGGIGNKLHLTTREWVVNNWLLFNPGDTLDIKTLQESERLLRSSGYFVDARVNPVEIPNDTDSVDVEVITQDRWTISVLASYNPDKNNSYIGVNDDNFLGVGHGLDIKLSHDGDPSVGLGTTVKYNVQNLAGKYINGEIRYNKDKKAEYKSLSLQRPFYTATTQWAGGIDLVWNNNRYEYILENGFFSTPYRESSQDVWAGYSMPVWFGPDVFQYRSRVVAALRIAHNAYNYSASTGGYSPRVFENSTLYLGSLGIINRRYYRDTYVDAFGITEDIEIGGYVSLTAGYDSRLSNSRYYLGSDIVFSRRLEGIGYISSKFSLGGFRNGDKWEQNVFNINFIYHSPLFSEDGWRWRFFLQSDILIGFNRFLSEQVFLNSDHGLRGADDYFIVGTKRTYLNLETRIFTPFSPLGFSIGGNVFADFGLITGRDQNLLNSRLYQGYGAGFRIRNQSISNAEFNIALVYNPYSVRAGGEKFSILFKTSIVLGSRMFNINKPSVVPYDDNGI